MGLVHREERDFDAAQRVEEALRPEPLRCHIDEFPFPMAHAIKPLLLLRPTERGIDHRRLDAAGDKRVHLILHQRDQGRDHQRHPAETQCGNLETQGFAAAGGHHHQTVAARDDLRNHLLLTIQKPGKAKILLECRLRRHHQGFWFGREQ